jgi:hypothetical protein
MPGISGRIYIGQKNGSTRMPTYKTFGGNGFANMKEE